MRCDLRLPLTLTLFPCRKRHGERELGSANTHSRQTSAKLVYSPSGLVITFL